KLAIADPNGKEWSRGELLSDCNRIVHGLRGLGLGEGDVVAAVLPNCAEFIALYQAVAQAGWYLVPINWHLAGPEVAYILEDSGAKAFISHEYIADSAIAAAKEANFPTNAAFSIGHIDGFRPWAELLADQPDTMPEDRSAGVVMNYTSGTTGKPKGVKRGLSGLDPETFASLFTMSMQMFGIQPEDNNVHITGSPLYHTAVMVWASNSLHLGHPVVLMEKWEAEDMLRLIDKYKVTHSHMVPTQFRRLLLLDEATRSKYDLSSLRYMIHAAAPCPPDVKQAMIDWWGMVIYEYYAATEGGGTLVTPEEWVKFPGTVGRPWPTAEVKIFDDDGNEMPTGEQGTVYMLLAENQRFEYKGDAAKTQKERLGNYFTVGDVGYLNEEGYLFLCDRKIDMIISGGANIYPAEIENVLIMHPKVADVAVFGIPNDDWGEEIKAAVEPAKGVAADAALSEELMAFCTEKLAKFKLPKSIDYLEELPRDPNGKLYKRRLRDPYWEGQAAKV
ncbi:MAG: acyl-CoA synthetase, partial [Pseudomonadales bacterium]